MTCAKWILKTIRDSFSEFKDPNFEKWADCVRLMRERDGRTYNQIHDLMKWAASDEFWRTNILSPAKLREKWDTLAAQRSRRKRNGRMETDNEPIAPYHRKHRKDRADA